MHLALLGGKKLRTKFFPPQKTIGKEEKEAVIDFLNDIEDTGNILSGYRGNWIPQFWGGTKVQELEKAVEGYLNAPDDAEVYALAVNSATSGLQIACGAIGIVPGDEVIVTPWSMSCSATAPMLYGGVPVFADIEADHFCLDLAAIEAKITNKTKAIIIVDLFGQPYDVEKINAIAKKHGLIIIEDAAQAIGSTYKSCDAGTLGDIGVFSFTQGKHLTAGEGGMLVTKDHDLYMKMALIRNHAEAVISAMPDEVQIEYYWQPNMIGFNMRMTEIQAVIVKEQLKKIYDTGDYIEYRQQNANDIMQGLADLPMIWRAKVRKECTHSYYVLPFFYDETKMDIPIPRDLFMRAVRAELSEELGRIDRGVPIGCGYITPLYDLPLFAARVFDREDYPVVEELHRMDFCLTLYHALDLKESDIADIVNAFHKVYKYREELLNYGV